VAACPLACPGNSEHHTGMFVNSFQRALALRMWHACTRAPSGRTQRRCHALRGGLKRFHLRCWNPAAPSAGAPAGAPQRAIAPGGLEPPTSPLWVVRS